MQLDRASRLISREGRWLEPTRAHHTLKKYFVYIIHSIKYDRYYIGHTSDLYNRITHHNNNYSRNTGNKGPWELVIFYACSSKSEAYRLELYLKNPQATTEYIKKNSIWIDRASPTYKTGESAVRVHPVPTIPPKNFNCLYTRLVSRVATK